MEQTLEFGAYRLDGEALSRGSQVVDLPPKALSLLRALIESHGRVVSKDELMQRLWPDATVAEANLSVTMALLRKTIDPREDGSSHVQTLARRGYRFVAPVRATARVARPSLAILPLLGPGPTIDLPLGLGLTDAMIERLEEMPRVIVRPTTAVVGYVGLARASHTIVEELDVDAIVTGTLRCESDRLRIDLKVTPRSRSMPPWEGAFDCDWPDLPATVGEMARRVAEVVASPLGPRDQRRQGPYHRPQPHAYETLLRGRQSWVRADVLGISEALKCFDGAAAEDPDLAEAHACASWAHLWSGLSGAAEPLSAWRLASDSALRALAIDPSLARAHVSAAGVALLRDWDWQGAREGLDRGCALAPAAVEWRFWRALFHALAGRSEEGEGDLAYLGQAAPSSLLAGAASTLVGLARESGKTALAAARRSVDLHPELCLGHWLLGLAELQAGRAEDACRSMRRAAALADNDGAIPAFLAQALAAAGRAREARAVLESMGTERHAYPRARVLATLGENASAVALLHDAAERREPWMPLIGFDRAWDSLGNEPRLSALRRKVLAQAS